jgi:hypothetical protein
MRNTFSSVNPFPYSAANCPDSAPTICLPYSARFSRRTSPYQVADAQVEHQKRRVDGTGGGVAGLVDEGTDIGQQFLRDIGRGRFCALLPATRSTLFLAHPFASVPTAVVRSVLL